jgi:hypothetical protein
LFWDRRRRAEFAFAQRTEIEIVRGRPPMIVANWSDTSFSVANDDGAVYAESASAAAFARASPQAEKCRGFIGHACLATHGSISSISLGKPLSVPDKNASLFVNNLAPRVCQGLSSQIEAVRILRVSQRRFNERNPVVAAHAEPAGVRTGATLWRMVKTGPELFSRGWPNTCH